MMINKTWRKKLLLLLLLGPVTICFIIFNTEHVHKFRDMTHYKIDDEDHQSIQQTCDSPKNNIFFLKTHKCGSTTVQNILMRYGLERDLDFVLPNSANYLGNPQLFSLEHIGSELRTSDDKYNVFTHHTRYNSTTMHQVMYGDARFVTIMRDPVALYESLYAYYGMHNIYNVTLKGLLGEPMEMIEKRRRLAGKIGQNQMSWDLGMTAEQSKNMSYVEGFIQDVEKDFDLVMMSEYMEVSLVLLSDLMCWSLEDVAFIPLNRRTLTSHVELTVEEQTRIRSVNRADDKLHQHFLKKFVETVRNYGIGRMRRKVTALLRINARLYNTCVQDVERPTIPNGAHYFVTYKMRKIQGEDERRCRYTTIDELRFTEVIRRNQRVKMKMLKELDKMEGLSSGRERGKIR